MSLAAPPRAVLLDTCALIWFANGVLLRPETVDAIVQAGLADGIYVSAVSAWEIGLVCKSRPRHVVQFLPDAKTWFRKLMTGASIREAPATFDIAIDASHLPGKLHGDPGDRLLIATARHLGVPIVTRDRKIIAYAEAGLVQAIAC